MNAERVGEPPARDAGEPRMGAGLRFSRALCAIDGTQESLESVGQVVALAGHDCELTLLIVTSFRREPELRAAAISPRRATEIVEQARRAAQAAGVSPRIEVDPAGPPAKVVMEWAAERDLLAIGVPATSWFGAMFMGGVAATAEDRLDSSLLVTRRDERPPDSPPHILVASDGLEGSDALVETAARIADAQDAMLTLLHVLGPESRMHPHRIEHQAERMRALVGPRAALRVEPGHAREAVVDVARAADASLIVLSSRRLTGLHAVGSVSRRVVHHAHCPVLLVAPERLHATAGAVPSA